MGEAIFPKGINFDRPHDRAPEFVKGKVSFKVDDAIEFLREHVNAKGYVNLDLKKAKNGRLYLQLDTWQPKGGSSGGQEEPNDPIPF